MRPSSTACSTSRTLSNFPLVQAFEARALCCHGRTNRQNGGDNGLSIDDDDFSCQRNLEYQLFIWLLLCIHWTSQGWPNSRGIADLNFRFGFFFFLHNFVCDSSGGGGDSDDDDRQLLAQEGIGNQKFVYVRQKLNDRNGFGRNIWSRRARACARARWVRCVVVMVARSEWEAKADKNCSNKNRHKAT